MPHTKKLVIELPGDPQQYCQLIKDAMAFAMMQKIDATGITDAQDGHYSVYQSVYLTAHYHATTCRNAAKQRHKNIHTGPGRCSLFQDRSPAILFLFLWGGLFSFLL